MKIHFPILFLVAVAQVVMGSGVPSKEMNAAVEEQLLLQQIVSLKAQTELPGISSSVIDPKCGTHVLQSLIRHGETLSPEVKEVLSDLGVDFKRRIAAFARPSGLAQTYDSGIFRFHFTLAGRDSVSSEDGDMDGVPDYINMMAQVFNQVAENHITRTGFIRPPSDSWYADNGGSAAYDIYVSQLGPSLFGYTQMEYEASSGSGDNEFSAAEEINAATSYIAMRNNYHNFTLSEEENIQVTAAHELLHAIQFGYDGWEAIWMLEATAVWIEDEVFDDINDNYQYLKDWLDEPHISLNKDRAPHWYGSWIFFRYLSEHIGGPSTVRKILEQSVRHNSFEGDFSIRTIDEALLSVGSSFSDALNRMVIANHLLTSEASAGIYAYEEGDAYRQYGILPRLERSVAIMGSDYIIEYDSGQLMHNAAHYIELTAGEGPLEVSFTPGDETVSFQTSGTVREDDGTVTVQPVDFNAILSIPAVGQSVVLAVVTDTTEDADYSYSIKLNPEVPLPSAITLYQNFPNPFNTETTFRFFLPVWERVWLKVFDLGGREVRTIPLPQVRQGFNDVTFEARHLPSGTYLVKLDGETETVGKKITLIK